MEPATGAPPAPRAQRLAVVVVSFVAAAAVVAALAVAAVIGYVLLILPTPHHPRTTTRADALASVEHDASVYEDLVIGVARTGPVTDDRLSTYAMQRPDSIGSPTAVTQGGRTVVTFSAHRSYGSSSAPGEVTGCYRITLAGTRTATRAEPLRTVDPGLCAPDLAG